MSTTIEWAHVAHNAFQLIEGDEDAGDGNTPNDEPDEGQLALVVDGCAIYGDPEGLIAMLQDGIDKVKAYTAKQ